MNKDIDKKKNSTHHPLRSDFSDSNASVFQEEEQHTAATEETNCIERWGGYQT